MFNVLLGFVFRLKDTTSNGGCQVFGIIYLYFSFDLFLISDFMLGYFEIFIGSIV